MRAQLRLVYLDESDCWVTKVTRHAGRIAGLYLYDANLHVCCCEITPSYALHLVGYLAERTVSAAVQQQMQACTEQGHVSYLHCGQVAAFRRVRRRAGGRAIDPFVAGRMPCSIALLGPWPGDHDAALAEALEALTEDGCTTTS